MTRFRRAAEARAETSLPGYPELHRFSVEHPAAFWSLAAEFTEIGFSAPARQVLSGDPMPRTRWFPGARLSYPRRLLARGREDAVAIFAIDESDSERRFTFGELRREITRCAAALRAIGIAPGDRIAAYLANEPEAVILLLASAAIGATFSSAPPSFGVGATADRFSQVEPKLLVASGSFCHQGKRLDTRNALAQLAAALPSVERVVVVGEAPAPFLAWNDLMAAAPGDQDPAFDEVPFDHPLYLLFSSGTTGLPKCFVHGTGGALLKHLVEQQLHCDIRPGDVVFYYTNVGWMMWNWLVSALAQGAAIVLYEGGPAYPSREALWRLIPRFGITHFGTSAFHLESCRAVGLRPGASFPVDSLRCLLSTGSPLSEPAFDWVYSAVKADLHLASISGGTDIVGCFVAGDPTAPVHRGQLQVPTLGADVAVLDQQGRELLGRPGELVCRNPIPSMPLRLLGDPEDARYRETYFQRFPGVWCHGDTAERTPEGGFVVHGRSDATLKPAGVRVGTAEIYRPLQDVPDVVEALAAGRRIGADVEIWLFVVLRPPARLDGRLITRIAATILRQASASHVPRRFVQVEELPRTRNGKVMELAVTRLLNGEVVTNASVLANPDCLAALDRAIQQQIPRDTSSAPRS